MKHILTQSTFNSNGLDTPYVVLDDQHVVHYSSSLVINIEQPDNEIWYTTTDGKIFSIGGYEYCMQNFINDMCDVKDGFGAIYVGPSVVSEVYEDNVWKIKFDGPITHVGQSVEWNSSAKGFTLYPEFCAGEAGNNIKTISLPKTVTIIDKSTFMACVELEEINIPDGVTHIEDKSFMFTTPITSLSLPVSITHLGGYIFEESTIEELNYAGTKVQFMSIDKDENWYKSGSSSDPVAITVVHCSDGDLTASNYAPQINPNINTNTNTEYEEFDGPSDI